MSDIVYKGTTPTHSFTLPFDAIDADVIWMTYSQKGREFFTFNKEDLTLNGKEVSVRLTQEHTLMFFAGEELKIQIRALRGVDAICSDEVFLRVKGILKDGVIGG